MNSPGTHGLVTVGDIGRDPRFQYYTKRQIEYAIDSHRIEPLGRIGIIRTFAVEQIPAILNAVRQTAQARRHSKEIKR